MKPQGRGCCKFPSKVDHHPRNGYINWWEEICIPNKKKDRQRVKKEITVELEEIEKKKGYQMELPSIKILGEDGNIFNLLGIAKRRFKELHKEEPDEKWDTKWQDFLDEVESSEDYTMALGVFMKYFEVE